MSDLSERLAQFRKKRQETASPPAAAPDASELVRLVELYRTIDAQISMVQTDPYDPRVDCTHLKELKASFNHWCAQLSADKRKELTEMLLHQGLLSEQVKKVMILFEARDIDITFD